MSNLKNLIKRYSNLFRRQPELAPNKSMKEVNQTYNDNISYAKDLLDKGKLTPENYQSFVEEEQGMVNDWKTRKKSEADNSAFKMAPETPLFGKISGPCKEAAKRKFDVWPSAYASGWGVRCTKAGGPSKMGKSKKKK